MCFKMFFKNKKKLWNYQKNILKNSQKIHKNLKIHHKKTIKYTKNYENTPKNNKQIHQNWKIHHKKQTYTPTNRNKTTKKITIKPHPKLGIGSRKEEIQPICVI